MHTVQNALTTPLHSNSHTTTHEIIQAYFIQIIPPPWGLKSKKN